MVSFEIDGNPVRLKHHIQGIGDLLPETFLYGEAPGKQTHQSGELGKADDVLMRNIPYVGISVKGQRMVLTEAIEGDRALDHLTQAAICSPTTLRLEDGEQFRIALIALGCIKERPQKALRRPLCSWSMQI